MREPGDSDLAPRSLYGLKGSKTTRLLICPQRIMAHSGTRWSRASLPRPKSQAQSLPRPKSQAQSLPRPQDLQGLGVALLDGGGIATSGDYQRYAVVDSIRYHHILDPATGYPSRGVMSVTVATERAVDADALATAVFVLGPDEGLALIERTPGAEAVLVTGDADSVGRVLVSSGLKEKFVEQ